MYLPAALSISNRILSFKRGSSAGSGGSNELLTQLLSRHIMFINHYLACGWRTSPHYPQFSLDAVECKTINQDRCHCPSAHKLWSGFSHGPWINTDCWVVYVFYDVGC